VVLVSGKPVMMLRMIVIVVGVGMEQRHHAGRRNQRRDEQRCQGAMHNDESMRRRRAGQNDGERRAGYLATIPRLSLRPAENRAPEPIATTSLDRTTKQSEGFTRKIKGFTWRLMRTNQRSKVFARRLGV